MKKLFWKLKYARYLKRKGGFTLNQGLKSAQATLESRDDALDEDPEYLAQEELYAWADCCR